jgi:hypothetical protein
MSDYDSGTHLAGVFRNLDFDGHISCQIQLIQKNKELFPFDHQTAGIRAQ